MLAKLAWHHFKRTRINWKERLLFILWEVILSHTSSFTGLGCGVIQLLRFSKVFVKQPKKIKVDIQRILPKTFFSNPVFQMKWETTCQSRMSRKIFLEENINLTNFEQLGLGTKLVILLTHQREIKHLILTINCLTLYKRWWLAQCSEPQPAAAWMGSLWLARRNLRCRWPRCQHNLHSIHVRQCDLIDMLFRRVE